MHLGSISTRNFRNLAPETIELTRGINLVAGDNGQGKTNLLEAVYFLATTRSFRTSRIASLSRTGSGLVYVEGELIQDSLQRKLSVGIELGPPRRRRLQVNEDSATLHDYVSEVSVVAYSADRLAVLRGGPEERRRFLDRGISHLVPGYLRDLSRYNRTLRQRNAMIQAVAESRERPAALDPWDHELVLSAGALQNARSDYVQRIEKIVARLIEEHGELLPPVGIEYQPSRPQADADHIDGLRAIRSREISAGHTLRGAHRDEVRITTGDELAAEILSSGQIKMLVLFLKMAKVEIQIERSGTPPVFVLDDVDAELDLGVIERLFRGFPASGQIVTSSAKPSVLEALRLGPHRILTMVGGSVDRVVDIT